MPKRMTTTDRRAWTAKAEGRPARATVSKYRAVRTEVDGITFASKKEAARYGELKLLEKAGSIRALELQPVFALRVAATRTHEWKNGPLAGKSVTFNVDKKVGVYLADFQYEELTETGGRWDRVVEDVKGVRTPVYRLKKKMVEAIYGITIREV